MTENVCGNKDMSSKSSILKHPKYMKINNLTSNMISDPPVVRSTNMDCPSTTTNN